MPLSRLGVYVEVESDSSLSVGCTVWFSLIPPPMFGGKGLQMGLDLVALF